MSQILVVDDERQTRDALRQILEVSGYQVTEAEDGKQAVLHFMKTKPDLVILDIIMPEQEGLATIVELRKLSTTVKILAISGGGRFVGTESLSVAKLLGADATLTKPFGHHSLLAWVRELLPA